MTEKISIRFSRAYFPWHIQFVCNYIYTQATKDACTGNRVCVCHRWIVSDFPRGGQIWVNYFFKKQILNVHLENK